MAFFGKIKRAFGFSDEDFEEDIEGIDATVKPYHPKSVADPDIDNREEKSADETTAAAETPRPVQNDSAPDEIFATVVKIFNESLPGFIKTGIDESAQRKYLYDALSQSMKNYLKELDANARERCRVEWETERGKLMSEASALKEKVKTIEESSSENKKQQLSAERQKRALNERLHDLEGKIAQLEAEKEQYELENRSLINKLRVSNVMSEIDCDAVEKISELNKKIEELTHENGELSVAVEQYKVKTEMSDVMINDLNTRASSAKENLEKREAEIEELKKSISDAEHRELELKEKIADINSELDSARLELEEAQSAMDVVEEIQAELDKFEEIKNSKNNQIAELQSSLRKRDERIIALEMELKSVRENIDATNARQQDNESRLADEVKRLNKIIETNNTAKESKKRKKAPIRISAIDEDLDSTDWLVATPPEGTNARPGGVPDNEFGYQEPVRKNPPENSAQMSLW